MMSGRYGVLRGTDPGAARGVASSVRGVVIMWFGVIFVVLALSLALLAAVMNRTGPTRPRHGDKPNKTPRMGRGQDWNIPGS
jgi:hypothetical protein